MFVLRDRARVRFVVTMTVFGVALWVVFRDAFMGPVLVPLRALTAEATLYAIQLTGLDGFRSTHVLVHSSGFAMEITRGCTGFAGAAVLIAGILSYPASSIERTFGIAACVPIFIAINLGRMTHLYHLGVAQSSFFHTAHVVVWQIGMMVAVFSLWFGWVRWTEWDRSRVGHQRDPKASFAGT